MTVRPHDVVDLYLAPVALSVDANLQSLSGFSSEKIDGAVALATNLDPIGIDGRQRAVLETVTHLVEMHGWSASWHERGLLLSHEEHRLVLGIPPSLHTYLGGG